MIKLLNVRKYFKVLTRELNHYYDRQNLFVVFIYTVWISYELYHLILLIIQDEIQGFDKVLVIFAVSWILILFSALLIMIIVYTMTSSECEKFIPLLINFAIKNQIDDEVQPFLKISMYEKGFSEDSLFPLNFGLLFTRSTLFLIELTVSVILVIYTGKIEAADLTDWASISQDGIEKALKRTFNEGIAKNVIIFIADGMGMTTSTAARIYGKGEQGFLTFDKFPNIGVLKTYSANKYVPDSCSTATAMFCGVKANQKTTGVDSTVDFEDCFGSLNPQARVSSIINWAQDAGFVTTTRVTHATPSALFAHSPNRNWECEAVIPDNARICKDIARQLIEDQPGKNINVIMGGGRQVLQSNVVGKNNDPIDTWACYSKDGRDLIKDWKDDKIRRNASYAFVSNNGELNNLNTSSEFVLGIFANGHLSMDHARDRSLSGMPSLANMTEKAIQVLQKNENGYILMVEGGLIDFGHHRGHAKQALNEAVRFSDTIERTLELIKDYESDTLVIVTSDHAHSLVFSGYADRGESVLGVAQKSKYGDFNNYTTLLYGTGGPNNYQFYVENNSVVRPDPALQDTEDFEYSQQAVVLTDEVTHSGADVLIYAKGPQAHMFHTVHDQTYVAYVIAYAAKIGPYSGGPSLYLAQNNLFLYIIICLFIYKFV
ncbi:alkaline phosphatase [Holotrichia oblita]|uniref:Alkaline phosphatase n=1 Tax=Holotrichia oblita TaxID=644536 RepID=A0ACB9SP09_HOLOL|nr:alkaline phosphatase [Holotrichia oblita]